MSENMKFWEKVKKTDPSRVKPITGKQYKGNSPQPYYLVERMTEEFGMCGIGWGLNIINERMERLTDSDVLHVAVVTLWFIHEGKRGEITQIGQTKAAYSKSSGGMMVDEDAPKKSVTDAMTKCMSYLGFAGDIFSGQWDDSKYVQSLQDEFNSPSKADIASALKALNTEAGKGSAALREAWGKLSAEIQAALRESELPKLKQAAKMIDENLNSQQE